VPTAEGDEKGTININKSLKREEDDKRYVYPIFTDYCSAPLYIMWRVRVRDTVCQIPDKLTIMADFYSKIRKK
jgi:hypothetical protein